MYEIPLGFGFTPPHNLFKNFECYRASKNPKSKHVVNPVLQNENLLFAEKLQWLVNKVSAGMCDVNFCPMDETAGYFKFY